MEKTVSILSFITLFSFANIENESFTNICNKTKIVASDKLFELSPNKSLNSIQITKKYDIKSGIITFDTKMEMAGMVIKSKKILYFDDYGNKECEEEYGNDPSSGKEIVKSRNFNKDGYHYILSLENNGGIKTKMRGNGVAAKFDVKEASTMKENKFVKLADETVCGKVCNAFSMETPSGKISMYGWNRITLKTLLIGNGMKSESKAIKIQENVSIPTSIFEIPKGMPISES